MRTKDLPRPLRNWLNKYVIFRPGIIYAYSCLDPNSGDREPWAYVGQTRQSLASRHSQHMGYDMRYRGPAQPWSDLYPEVRIVWQGKVPDFFLDLIEEYYIKSKKAVYNYMHNTKNPRRVTKHDALLQRSNRDRLVRMRRPW